MGFAEGAADHTQGVRERRSAGRRSGRRHRRQRPEAVGVDHDASERVHVTLRPFGRSDPVYAGSVSLVPEGTSVSARRLISHPARSKNGSLRHGLPPVASLRGAVASLGGWRTTGRSWRLWRKARYWRA